jgi:protein gp37
MNETPIEWTDFSSNPLKYRDTKGNVVWGCIKKSPGCANCYSEHTAGRWHRGGPFTAAIMRGLMPFLDDKELHRMLTYKPASGKRCFVGDMTDLFGEWVSDELLDQLFATFAMRSNVTWQVLTKCAERLPWYFKTSGREERISKLARWQSPASFPWPLPNVWLGVSVERQREADERREHFRATPAAVKFVSYEPALGPVDWTRWEFVQQIISGGESGPNARPNRPDWHRATRDFCVPRGIAYFLKQLGSNVQISQGEPPWGPPSAQTISGRVFLKDKKGGDVAEWPEDLRVRQFPEVAVGR